ncbi:MAG: HPP family protein [Actinomycetales bacterium]
MGAPSDSRGAVIWRVVAGTAITTTILGLAAAGLAEPLIFPSLGPTIFLLLFLPLNVMSAPRNVIAGHGIGMASGYLALGILRTPLDLAVMMSAVVTVVLCSFAVNRIARIPAPVWSPPKA